MSEAPIARGTVAIHAWDGGHGLVYLEAKDACGSIIAADTFREAINALDAVYDLQNRYPDSTVKFGL